MTNLGWSDTKNVLSFVPFQIPVYFLCAVKAGLMGPSASTQEQSNEIKIKTFNFTIVDLSLQQAFALSTSKPRNCNFLKMNIEEYLRS